MATLAVIASVLPHIADLGNKLAPVIVMFLGKRLANIHRMKKELEALESLFTALRTGLDELEHRKIYEGEFQVRQIKDWIGKLKDVAYDLEDMLDECHVMASDSLGDHEEDCHPSQDTDHNENDHPQPVVRLRKRDKIKLYAGVLFGDLADRLKGLSARVTQIMEEKRIFEPHIPSGRSDHGSSRSHTTFGLSAMPSSHMNSGEIVGRWNEREKIVKWLTMPDNIEGEKSSASKVGLLTKIPTMVIVGTPGVGKTAVAQLVYNDVEVFNYFDARMWVSVSNDFDEVKLTEKLIEGLGTVPMFNELNVLQDLLIQLLRGKSFLIVLDDVWGDVTNQKWENFLEPLRRGLTWKSRILVTGSNEIISSRMRIRNIHRLDPLPFEASLDLFQKNIAITSYMSESQKRDLEELDIYMVQKCEGLPICIKAMTEEVSKECNKEKWEIIVNTKTLWDLLMTHNRSFLSLLLRRFYELDAPLRRCFLSCCLYPKGKDTRIPVDELKHFWIAAGFITAKRRRDMELLAQDYVDELVKSSFFQYHTDSARTACWVHDLFYELAKFLGEEEYSTGIASRKARYVITSLQDAIRASSTDAALGEKLITLKLRCSGDDADQLPNHLFSNMKSLRGLIMNGVNLGRISGILSNLRRLRHLDLSKSKGDSVPVSIKKLDRLRLLDLSNTSITQLPNQIDHLRYLETLILIGCDHLTQLPKSICNMVQLRHLRVDGTNQLKSFPKGIAKLNNLESLDVFKFNSEECKIMELKNLNNLQGKLAIECNGTVEIGKSDGHYLSDKVHLKSLDLQFRGERDVTGQTLEVLKPNEGLEELVVKNYNGRRLATWMMSTTMTQLVSLTLISCHHVSELPSFGQLPCLRNLCINGMSGVRRIEREFYTCSSGSSSQGEYTLAFPMLEILQVLDLPNLERWVDVDRAMPKLEVLVIEGAMKLGYIPRCVLRGLKSIEIASCALLEHRYYTQMHELYDIRRVKINGGLIVNN